jgi:hypothetical protein
MRNKIIWMLGECSEGGNGGMAGQEGGCMVLGIDIDHICPVDITEQGESKWGYKDGKNAPKTSGDTVGATEHKISTHQ